MPKIKTHQGMSKRIKVTGSGKLLHRKAYRGHLLGGKQLSLKRTYVKEFEVASGDHANVKRMIGK
ncbi:MAG TPA: 50S ribosomal protein L35 [Candidatus Saccharimonadales bacterium]|nr:50S ribosomal protein L35 [Candidatus Saccharimonadales bacterium]